MNNINKDQCNNTLIHPSKHIARKRFETNEKVKYKGFKID